MEKKKKCSFQVSDMFPHSVTFVFEKIYRVNEVQDWKIKLLSGF